MSEQPTLLSINSELVRLNGNLERHIDLTRERQDRQGERIEKHSIEIFGQGALDPGLKNHMTRVLLIQNISIWVIVTISTGVLGLLINAVWSFIIKIK